MSAVQSAPNYEHEKLAPPKRAKNSATDVRANWTGRVVLCEFCVVLLVSYGASALYHMLVWGNLPSTGLYIPFSVFLGTCYSLICLIDNQYDLHGEKWRKDGLQRALGALSAAFTLFLAVIFVVDLGAQFSRGTFLFQLALTGASIVIARVILVQQFERAVQSGRARGRGIVVVSFGTDDVDRYAAGLCSKLDQIVNSYQVSVPQFGSEGNRRRMVAEKIARIRNECRKPGIDVVAVIYEPSYADVAQIAVEGFYETPIQIRLLPVGIIPFMQHSRVVETGSFPTLEISTQPLTLLNRFIKRTLDLAISTTALVLLSPLFLFVALAIKLDSPGSILYRQKRHGLNNEPIEVLKFRTMKASKPGEKFRQTNRADPRVTRVGRMLRRSNIDELPQLINVLRGEMSVVGPRPHATIHNEQFADRIRMIYRRHNMKPGITGWAQVNGLRGATDTCDKMEDRIEYDLYYIDNWSIFFDIKILLMTILSRKAYVNAY